MLGYIDPLAWLIIMLPVLLVGFFAVVLAVVCLVGAYVCFYRFLRGMGKRSDK